jgi:hypothetical protein
VKRVSELRDRGEGQWAAIVTRDHHAPEQVQAAALTEGIGVHMS